MISWPLFQREMKKSFKLFVILAAVMTMYVSVIISLYDPEMMLQLDQFYEAMPELMAAIGTKLGETTLIGFMVSYLYGFILILFPLLFSAVRANGLIAKYVDSGSIVGLLSAPVKRSKIAFTQMTVLIIGIILLIAYVTCLQILLCMDRISISALLRLNFGLLCLHLLIGSISFLASCYFSDVKYSFGVGAGVSLMMFVLQMLRNAGKEFIQYFTFFTLFDTSGLVSGSIDAFADCIILLILAIVLYFFSVKIFVKKDLYI